jgi:hypothetical protein
MSAACSSACGRSSVGSERGFPKPEAAGSIPAAHSRFEYRGLGKRFNPLGLGPRESRFKSEVPDQFLWGSQVVRRLAVNQFMRRFESCPHSQNAGVAFWLRAPLLQRGAVEFDPLPRHQHSEVTARLWPRGFRHRSSKAIHAGSSPARRSMPRSFSGRTKVFEAFYVGSIPALGAKLVLAWCTVHRRTYKPLRSRSEHGLGSTPSASTMRSKLMRMSSRFLIVRQLVRFQPDAPNLWNCGRMVRRSTFNRGGESSILSSSTNCRRRLVVGIADLQSADGSSILLAGTN